MPFPTTFQQVQQAAPQSNLPGAASQQQQTTAAAGVDTISQMMQAVQQADIQAAQLAKAAAQPVAGGHQLPGSFISPGPAPHEMYAYDTRTPMEGGVVGRGNAQARGIVNLSKGVANLVGQVTQAETRKKTQRLAVNIERLMSAVNASDQAQQILNNDPSNAAAQDQLKRATAIQDEILGDDKNRKAIEKAYNISFTDPSKNNTPEHAALKQATDSYAQQFQAKLPTQLQPDPQRVAAAQAAAAQAKATRETVNKLIPSIVHMQGTLGAAEILTQGRKEMEASREKSAQAIQFDKDMTYLKGQNIHAAAMIQAANIRANAMKYEADKRLEALTTGPGGINPKSLKAVSDAFNAISNSDKVTAQSIANWKTLRDSPDTPDSMKEYYDSLIRSQEYIHNQNLQTMKSLTDKISDLAGTPKAQPYTPPTPQQGGGDTEGILSRWAKAFRKLMGTEPDGQSTTTGQPATGQPTSSNQAGQQPPAPNAQTAATIPGAAPPTAAPPANTDWAARQEQVDREFLGLDQNPYSDTPGEDPDNPDNN